MHVRLAYFWPLITRCPLSIIPDVGNVWVETNGFIEVLAWRRMVKDHKGKKLFAETLATSILTGSRRLVDKKDSKVLVTYRRWFGLITVKAGDTW